LGGTVLICLTLAAYFCSGKNFGASAGAGAAGAGTLEAVVSGFFAALGSLITGL